MRPTLLTLLLASLAAALLMGCGASTSTTIAPDVKEPDTSGMSREEVLRLKQQGEVKTP